MHPALVRRYHLFVRRDDLFQALQLQLQLRRTSSGEREIQRELRRILWTKYQIKDQALFDRAYAYIKEYY